MTFKSPVYRDNVFLGEADVSPRGEKGGVWAAREIRISHLSPASDRSPPLAVLYTVAADGFCFKMELPYEEEGSPAAALHADCLREKKTAVFTFLNEELHLVAMPSRTEPRQYSCFWGFTVASGLYASCLAMLNLRCLGIVFDLDETLVVANTMRSFEDRIHNLQQKLNYETCQQRRDAMLDEIKRYQEDKSILKQYVENDQVIENGKLFQPQLEAVPPLSESHQEVNRPVVRLAEKSIVLTRINPAIRDTSVLVHVRPAWEDLRSYLTARGRKRFEVYVCTMAERDYALEIWRLLDPESKLINFNELLKRIVCVNSDLKKSLSSVFQDEKCHPKMGLVIDDRLMVWDLKDKPRVHVVPAFAPYYAPQAEVVSSVAVLCVARNVACNVRGGFFKEYDETLLPCITAAYYEDEMNDFPAAPDVSNYLIPEDDNPISNVNEDPLCFDGMADAEVERRLKETNCNSRVVPMTNNFNYMHMGTVQHVMSSSSAVIPSQLNNPFPQLTAAKHPLSQHSHPEHSIHGSLFKEEGEVNESEMDRDTRRRLLILQHGKDIGGPSLQIRPHLEVSVSTLQTPNSWMPPEAAVKLNKLNEQSGDHRLQPETVHFPGRQSNQLSFIPIEENITPTDSIKYRSKRLSAEVHNNSHNRHGNLSRSNSLAGDDVSHLAIYSRNSDGNLEAGRATAKIIKNPVEVLERIATEAGAKVKYRTDLLNTIELQFSVEVWFVGEKIGEGTGRTRKQASRLAADKAIRYLANRYLKNCFKTTAFHEKKLPCTAKEMCVISDNLIPDSLPKSSNGSQIYGHRYDELVDPSDAVTSLKELCTLKGFSVSFVAHHPLPGSSDNDGTITAQVEVAEQLLGKGTGVDWKTAKLQAAEEALVNLKSMLSLGQITRKHTVPPQ